MRKEFRIINGKKESFFVYNYEEVSHLFNSDNWEKQTMDKELYRKIGLGIPNKTFLVIGSFSSEPTSDGKIAGICSLRIDEKDAKFGYPINSNHFDFIMENENEVILRPSKQKLKKHWFESEEEWQDYIKNNPPHEAEF